MTIAIGINFGAYVMLVADTRTTFYDWSGRARKFHDDSVKIRKTTIGLITGAGSLELLDLVKDRLYQETILDATEILNIIREETLRFRTLYGEITKEYIDKTGWIFSYKKRDNSKLRLAIYHPEVGDRIGLYEENMPALISPVEATEEQAKVIDGFLQDSITPCDQFETLEASFQHHWPKITLLIRQIAPIFPSISSKFQIGVHTSAHITGISPIVNDTDEIIRLDLTPDC
jgi:hypothetical protein